MSRCFPYPPPGYERKNGSHDMALIESIKLEREREQARKERRKEKKREKKEKKEKEKGRGRDNGEIEKEKQSYEKRHKYERSKVYQNGGDYPKGRDDETEQLEKSGLTEEHGQPSKSQNLYDSSDSTQNSKKRKRHNSSSDSVHNYGSVLCIRLPLLKHKDSEALPLKEQPCSTSNTEIIFQELYETASRPSKAHSYFISGKTGIVAEEKCVTTPRPGKEEPCSTSGRTEIPTKSIKSTFSQIKSQFRDLIENWVPSPMQSERTDFDDQGWLFDTKQHHKQESKRLKASNSGPCGNSALRIWGCYLPEADIYALPFTVPF